MEQVQQKGALSSFTPAQIFIFGIVAGLLVLCTIGFFVLLGLVVNGNVSLSQVPNSPRVVNTAPTVPGAQAPTVDVAANLPPVDEKTDHIRGSKRAKVTVVEYSDFECPFCGNFYPTTKQLLAEYPNDVRLVYRHFPLSFHPQATPAAIASECAAEQGKFWEYHDKLFENQERLGTELYKEIAQTVGLNSGKFNDCVSSNKYQNKVLDQQAGGAAAGVGGTPHSIILGEDGTAQVVSGAQPYSVVKSIVDQLL